MEKPPKKNEKRTKRVGNLAIEKTRAGKDVRGGSFTITKPVDKATAKLS